MTIATINDIVPGALLYEAVTPNNMEGAWIETYRVIAAPHTMQLSTGPALFFKTHVKMEGAAVTWFEDYISLNDAGIDHVGRCVHNIHKTFTTLAEAEDTIARWKRRELTADELKVVGPHISEDEASDTQFALKA